MIKALNNLDYILEHQFKNKIDQLSNFKNDESMKNKDSFVIIDASTVTP